jgi:hypothetical protein
MIHRLDWVVAPTPVQMMKLNFINPGLLANFAG